MTTPSPKVEQKSEGLPHEILDLEDLLDELGIDIGKSDEFEVWGRCPGHARRVGRVDRHPSWSISRLTGDHHCFGCGYGGSLVSLLMEVRGIGMWEALTFVGAFGLTEENLDRAMHPRRGSSTTHVDKSALDAFDSPPIAEISKRDLTKEACDFYNVRWDSSEEAWILPFHDEQGALAGWQSKTRRLVRNYPVGVLKSEFLFGLSQYIESKSTAPLVLVESPLDVVRLWVAGVDGGVSSYGVGVSTQQIRLCIEHSDHLILALDNDEAGRSMTKQLVTGVKIDSRGKEHKIPTVWGGRIKVDLYNYGDSEAKDPGEQTDEEIDFGIDHPLPNAVVSTW